MPFLSEADKKRNGNAWDNEYHQRNCIDRGLSRLDLSNNDIIMISDVDEIPDANILELLKKKEIKGLIAFNQEVYYYNLNCRHIEQCSAARFIDYESYKVKFNSVPQEVRNCMTVNYEIKCGWHFTYFMNTEDIANKIKNFAHQEFNNENYTNEEKIKEKIKNNEDLFGRNMNHIYIEVNENKYLPKHYKMLLDDE